MYNLPLPIQCAHSYIIMYHISGGLMSSYLPTILPDSPTNYNVPAVLLPKPSTTVCNMCMLCVISRGGTPGSPGATQHDYNVYVYTCGCNNLGGRGI